MLFVWHEETLAMILVVTTAASDLDYCGLDMRENLILLHANIEGKKRPACAYTQSDQHLCYSLSRNYGSLTCFVQIFYILAICSYVSLDQKPQTHSFHLHLGGEWNETG